MVLAFTDRFQIIAFSDEEGIRFQTTFLGSSAVAGTFQPKHLKNVDARYGLRVPLWRSLNLILNIRVSMNSLTCWVPTC